MAAKDINFDFEKEFTIDSNEKPEEKVQPSTGDINVSVISEKKEEIVPVKEGINTKLFVIRTTANREEQVIDFLSSNIIKKGYNVYSIFCPHGMTAYVFAEAESLGDVELAIQNIPYARGVLGKEVQYSEVEHMLAQSKREVNIRINDIVEIITGPFKRETAKVTRIDKTKEEVVVELLEAAVSIPITVKIDAVKVIRRNDE